MKKATGSVRMGPISLVALVIVLCMSVMCVLSITTAQAMFSSTKRQADATVEVYACEQAGQQFLANVDEVLAGVRSSGASKEAALAALQGAGDELVSSIDITPAQTSQTTPLISSAVEVAENTDATTAISATFVTDTDRRLSVELALNDDATYRILSWKTTTFWNNYNTSNDTLWTGEATD